VQQWERIELIKVLVIDDSAVVRKVLFEQLSSFDDIEVVGTAVDPYIARDKIVALHPDVLTLDIEMPRMDGLTFLSKLMRQYPLPVVVLSSLAPKNSENAMTALRLGAVEVLSKPSSRYSTPDVEYLAQVIRAASRAKVRKLVPSSLPNKNPVVPTPVPDPRAANKIVAIGASTGGTNTIETILRKLPQTSPGTVIVQHMPQNFTQPFADRLNGVCSLRVKEACDGDAVVPGNVLIAPGDRHMLLECHGTQYCVRVKDGPKVHYQRPSVDVLFYSVVRKAGENAVGVLLTGMGADGARGLLAMREGGARTIAQDEESCVVFGMPKEAINMGAVQRIVGLKHMAKKITHAWQS